MIISDPMGFYFNFPAFLGAYHSPPFAQEYIEINLWHKEIYS